VTERTDDETAMSLNYSFAGKKVLVTGGARGIGLAITRKFYDDGAHLFVLDNNQTLLEDLRTSMPNATIICQDLLEWDATRRTIEALGPLDHLVNNAGTIQANLLIDATESEFDLQFGVNVKAVINCSAAFVSSIKSAQGSEGFDGNAGRTIVNISSIGDRKVGPYFGMYSGTKAAVTMLTKQMAVEFAPFNVRANAVCPGAVQTEFLKGLSEEIIATVMSITSKPLIQEPILPSDIANTVLFLSSPLSSKITGDSVVVDAGIAR